MKNVQQAGLISLPQSKRQCKLYQQLGQFAQNLDLLPDAQAVLKDKARSAPVAQVPMIF